MTRLNLSQTCLLEVSGELGQKAKAQLQEHVAKFPAALVEYELTRGQFEMLRSLPKVALTDEQRRQMASNIKQGVHRKLRQQEEEVQDRHRRQIVYRLMAGVTAMAAGLVITIGIMLVQEQIVQDRHEALVQAQRLQDYFNSTAENMTDYQIHQVASEIGIAEDTQASLNAGESRGRAMQALVEGLDVVINPE